MGPFTLHYTIKYCLKAPWCYISSMSTINYQPSRTNSESGFAKVIAVVVIVIVIILAALGYFAYAKSQNMWPYKPAATSSNQAKPSVEISKLAFESEALNVSVKVKNVEDGGHCVLIVSGKTTGFTIDNSKVEMKPEAQAAFKDCTGWSVGAKDLPAGEYNIEVKFVGPTQKLSATKMVTKE